MKTLINFKKEVKKEKDGLAQISYGYLHEIVQSEKNLEAQKKRLFAFLRQNELYEMQNAINDLYEVRYRNNVKLHHINRILTQLENGKEEKMPAGELIYALCIVYKNIPKDEVIKVICLALANTETWNEFFTKDGKLKKSLYINDLIKLLDILKENLKYYGFIDSLDDLLNIFHDYLLDLHGSCVRERRRKKEGRRYHEAVGIYYNNYTLKKMPLDVDAFLTEASYYLSASELIYLQKLITEKQKEDNLALVFSSLSKSDEATYNNATSMLQEDDPQEDMHYYLKTNLNDFEAAADLYLEATDSDDVLYLQNEMNASLQNLSIVPMKRTRKKGKK